MKKAIMRVFLLTCTVAVLLLIPLFMSHDSPIQVKLPQLTTEELAAQKQEAAKQAQETARKAQLSRIYSCRQDEDCLIVDKDPCGCSVGPKGVVAININYITDFNALNSSRMITKTCSSQVSTLKECSPSARAVCKARTCKIVY